MTDKTIFVASAIAFAVLVFVVSIDKINVVEQATRAQRTDVVRVHLTVPSNRPGFTVYKGSGVLVSDNKVLTNNHVVRGYETAEKVEVILITGEVRTAQVLKVDKVNDLALLKIAPVLYPYNLPGEPVSKGDKVTICGFPDGGAYTEVVGKVVGWAAPGPNEPNTIFKVDNETRGGMSGGPVLDRHGALVGLLFGCKDYANCVDIAAIKNFLSE